MPKVSISEAARLAGISRQHLYKRWINTGLLSVEKEADNSPVIDTSELLRVFGELGGNSQDDRRQQQEATPQNSHDYMVLQAELKAARELLADRENQLREAKERENWLKQHVTEVTSALRLLEHRTEPVAVDDVAANRAKAAEMAEQLARLHAESAQSKVADQQQIAALQQQLEAANRARDAERNKSIWTRRIW